MSARSLTVATLVGSLRQASFNRMVLATAADVAPEGVNLVEHRFDEVPLFDQDIEDAGEPEAVATLRAAVSGVDGLLIVTPEYNGGIPGGLKNAIDWLSRTPGDSALSGQKVGIIGASPGGRGAASVRDQLQLMMTFISGGLHEPTLGLSQIATKAADGVVHDPDSVEEIRAWMAGFAAFLRG